jgi:hypothetical protein
MNPQARNNLLWAMHGEVFAVKFPPKGRCRRVFVFFINGDPESCRVTRSKRSSWSCF